MIFNFRCHTLTVGSKYFEVVWNWKIEEFSHNIHVDGQSTSRYSHAVCVYVFFFLFSCFFVLLDLRPVWSKRADGLTVGAQGSGQHPDALVPDGVSGGQLGAQRSAGGEAGRHGAGRGGRGFRGVDFSLPGKKSNHTVCIEQYSFSTGGSQLQKWIVELFWLIILYYIILYYIVMQHFKHPLSVLATS